jgi:hypothetical protein
VLASDWFQMFVAATGGTAATAVVEWRVASRRAQQHRSGASSPDDRRSTGNARITELGRVFIALRSTRRGRSVADRRHDLAILAELRRTLR